MDTLITIVFVVSMIVLLTSAILATKILLAGLLSTYDSTINLPKTCPHGHEDWNDCPDCCH